LSWLYWPELRFTNVNTWTEVPGTILGIGIVALLLITAVRGFFSRQWLWLGLLIYCGAMIAVWPNPVPRYLVPLLPLITVATLDALAWLARPDCGTWQRRICAWLYKGFVASVILCNVALWCVDVWVAHAPNFYGRFEAGTNKELIAASRYLRSNTPASERIGVSTHYDNLGRPQREPSGPRVVVLLADRKVCIVPAHIAAQPHASHAEDKELLKWCMENHTQLYLYQAPLNPWRVWHFRVPAWLQNKMANRPEDEVTQDSTTSGWQLWEIRPGVRTRISLDDWQDWPRRVPGL
jgi:hypothetical protein